MFHLKFFFFFLIFRLCEAGSLDSEKVSGKIVLCLRGNLGSSFGKAANVEAAGGVGIVIYNSASTDYNLDPPSTDFPSISVSYSSGLLIKQYIYSTMYSL